MHLPDTDDPNPQRRSPIHRSTLEHPLTEILKMEQQLCRNPATLLKVDNFVENGRFCKQANYRQKPRALLAILDRASGVGRHKRFYLLSPIGGHKTLQLVIHWGTKIRAWVTHGGPGQQGHLLN
jgi:hypothetical protein